jgi:hypothetical protein
MAKQNTWLAFAEDNNVVETPGAKKAVFKPAGTPVTPAEGAKFAAESQAGIHPETMLAGFEQMESYFFREIMRGRHYRGTYFTLMQSIRGVILPNQPLNEVEYKLGVRLLPTEELRALLKTVHVEIIGQKDFEDFAKITAIEDAETERTDGFITPGDELYVHGDKIKIQGEEDEDGKLIEEGIGVFFVPDNGAAPIPAKRVRQNQPAFLNVKMPTNLNDNTKYTLRIVTRFTNGTTLLNAPRTVDFNKKLFTKDPTPAPTAKVRAAKVAKR